LNYAPVDTCFAAPCQHGLAYNSTRLRKIKRKVL